jgi:hypothetical protein
MRLDAVVTGRAADVAVLLSVNAAAAAITVDTASIFIIESLLEYLYIQLLANQIKINKKTPRKTQMKNEIETIFVMKFVGNFDWVA